MNRGKHSIMPLNLVFLSFIWSEFNNNHAVQLIKNAFSLCCINLGNEDELNRVLIDGADIDAVNEATGDTALILAASKGGLHAKLVYSNV